MDVVTKNLIRTFQKEESLQNEPDEAVVFEHFANFCVVANEYGDEFDVEDIRTGGNDDLGIDGLAIIVNGALITNVDELEDLAEANKHLAVEFILCQAKSSTTFSGADISNVFYGTKELFSVDTKLPKNIKLQSRAKIIASIYERSALFKRGNPILHLYYVTTGKWQDDLKLTNRIDNESELISELNIFETVEFHPIDARKLQYLYKRAKNRLSRTIEFSTKVTLPAIDGIEESYLGYVPIGEYIKLLTDDSGALMKGLFYDNIRDFQGNNPVNQEIEQTITSNGKELFVLMNNGVTIVADSIKKTGDTFTIEDYQIVNGCQTSHVLYRQRDTIGEMSHLSVKLIVSRDSDVKNRIIKATNRQTPVKTVELTALTDFQKSLEDYYAATAGDAKLYYERRSQQYRSVSGIEKIRIVSISNQIRAFSSMFLGMSHQASRYYGTLLKTIEDKIFITGHPPSAYYASALALYRLESFLRKKTIDRRYRPFKYPLLAIVRIVLAGDDVPAMTSNKFDRYCARLVTALGDEKRCLEGFQKSLSGLDAMLSGDYNRDKAKDATLPDKAVERISD